MLRYLFLYRGHYVDYLSIIETYLADNNFDEALVTLFNMHDRFNLLEEQSAELQDLQTYIHWLKQLDENDETIYKLNEKELDYLTHYVEASTGRGNVFAHNILCELYGICLEAEGGERYEVSGENGEGIKGETEKGEGNKSPSNIEGVPEGRGSLYENITLVPNPTTGKLTITNYELSITGVEIFDVYGRKLSHIPYLTSHISNLIDISHLQAGIYFVKIKTELKEVVKKIVKM